MVGKWINKLKSYVHNTKVLTSRHGLSCVQMVDLILRKHIKGTETKISETSKSFNEFSHEKKRTTEEPPIKYVNIMSM